MKNKVKFLSAVTLKELEKRINDFCETHEVFSTQFPPCSDKVFVAAVWYRELIEGEAIKV